MTEIDPQEADHQKINQEIEAYHQKRGQCHLCLTSLFEYQPDSPDCLCYVGVEFVTPSLTEQCERVVPKRVP